MMALRRLLGFEARGMGRSALFTAFAALVLLGAFFVQPALAHKTNGQPDTAGTDIGYALAPDGQNVTMPGQTGIFFFKFNSTIDSLYGVREFTSVTRMVDTIFSDTLVLSSENTGTPGDTVRFVSVGDTAAYILSVTNLGNTTDSIGFVLDTIVVKGYEGQDTAAGWSYQFYKSTGDVLGSRMYRREQDTVFIRLSTAASDTIILRVFQEGAPNTSAISFRFRSYVANGNARKFAVKAYRGFDGDTYGGDGHDSITLYAEISIPTEVRVSKSDTVFSPVSLGRGISQSFADDTQHYVPGAIVVYTIWFDQDSTDTTDTVIIEDWIDTRYVRFDSGGLRSLLGDPTQIAAAGTYVVNSYGNIFVDSGMPLDTSTAAPQYNVQLEYYNAGSLTPLTPSVDPNKVGRIRWSIMKNSGNRQVLGAHNYNSGDAQGSADAAPLAVGAGTDIDMGYVRFSVVIR